MWIFAVAILAYELLHLAAEASMRATPSGGCRAVVVLPVRRPRDLRRFAGVVDYVVVDDEVDAEAAEAAGLRWVLNKYGGKSGALATALEEVEADLYVFIDDDAYPGRWLEALRGACGRFATAYRWVLDRFQNLFSLGGFDWMVWRRTRFLYGGAMSVPAARRREAAEALKRCPVDDMALTAVAGNIEVLPVLVPMDGAEDASGFFLRQACGDPLLRLVDGGGRFLSASFPHPRGEDCPQVAEGLGEDGLGAGCPFASGEAATGGGVFRLRI